MRVLQPIRDGLNRPVIISSGYRCKMLNKVVGGSAGSQHQFGEAADFSVVGLNHLTVVRWIETNLTYDQLILEHWRGGSSGWIHCSFSRTHNRQQSLYIDRNGTTIGIAPKLNYKCPLCERRGLKLGICVARSTVYFCVECDRSWYSLKGKKIVEPFLSGIL
jgi:hypothetical protein